MVRRKKNITPGRTQRAYAEKRDIQVVLQDLELFSDGYYDIEIVYQDASTDEEVSLYKERGRKPIDRDGTYEEKKSWNETFSWFSRWNNFQETLKNSKKGVPVKIFRKKCEEANCKDVFCLFLLILALIMWICYLLWEKITIMLWIFSTRLE